jgi:acetyltransferase-like isoleucine patch superfamily enzyme
MTSTSPLTAYRDDRGNTIEYDGPTLDSVRVTFTGRNNRMTVASPAKFGALKVDFNCDNAVLECGPHPEGPAFSGGLRLGQDSQILIGRNVTSTSGVTLSATEGTTVRIGDDVMFASSNQVRADDGHPIFDVRTGDRVNVSRDITIGNHVWLAGGAVVLGGVSIGDGTVIGYGSVVTRDVPNNCIAVGAPAAVVRRDTAWERPHLSLVRPYYKPTADTVTKSPYWALTEGGQRDPGPQPTRERTATPRPRWRRGMARVRRAARVLVFG